MRGLGLGQTLEVIVVEEIMVMIQASVPLPSYSAETVPAAVVAFLVANSCQSEKLQETQLIFQNLATVWRRRAITQLLGSQARERLSGEGLTTRFQEAGQGAMLSASLDVFIEELDFRVSSARLPIIHRSKALWPSSAMHASVPEGQDIFLLGLESLLDEPCAPQVPSVVEEPRPLYELLQEQAAPCAGGGLLQGDTQALAECQAIINAARHDRTGAGSGGDETEPGLDTEMQREREQQQEQEKEIEKEVQVAVARERDSEVAWPIACLDMPDLGRERPFYPLEAFPVKGLKVGDRIQASTGARVSDLHHNSLKRPLECSAAGLGERRQQPTILQPRRYLYVQAGQTGQADCPADQERHRRASVPAPCSDARALHRGGLAGRGAGPPLRCPQVGREASGAPWGLTG
jgi:hypothetical protein